MPSKTEIANWKLVAEQSNHRYLIWTKGQLSDPMARGRILDTRSKVIYPEQSVQSVLARGYWDVYSDPKDVSPDLLKDVSEFTS